MSAFFRIITSCLLHTAGCYLFENNVQSVSARRDNGPEPLLGRVKQSRYKLDTLFAVLDFCMARIVVYELAEGRGENEENRITSWKIDGVIIRSWSLCPSGGT